MLANDLRTLPVTELVTPLRTLDSTDTVSHAIGYLVGSKSYETFIEDEEKVGVVSIRDLLGVSNISMRISSLMKYIPALNKYNTVGDAATLMFEYRIRSLPVHEKRKLIGQIRSSSIAKSLLFELETRTKASAIMTGNPISVDSADNVGKARSIMMRRRIDQLPVLKNGKLQSVVTSEDIVANLLPPPDRDVKGDWRKGRFETAIEDFAETNLVTNLPEDTLRGVYLNMSNSGTNYSIIEANGEVMGIITYRDIMKLLSRNSAVDDLVPMYIVGLPDDPFESGMAREKFASAVNLLRKEYPKITEARAIIRTGLRHSHKIKNEVRVLIISSPRNFVYKGSAFRLLDAFEGIEAWAKSIASRKLQRPTRVRTDSRAVEELK